MNSSDHPGLEQRHKCPIWVRVSLPACSQGSGMGTCWDRVCGSLLFLPLYLAVRAQGPILSDILLLFTQPAGPPRSHSLCCVPAARGLVHQGEGTGQRGGERRSLGGCLFPWGGALGGNEDGDARGGRR